VYQSQSALEDAEKIKDRRKKRTQGLKSLRENLVFEGYGL
jgi:hypothetical protein